MNELIKSFEGKKVLIYVLGSDNEQITGRLVVPEGNAAWLKVEKEDGTSEIVNPDYIRRIREYPVDKKGKPRSVIVD